MTDASLTPPSTSQLVADRLEILDVVTRYCTAIDQRDFERLRECFTPDVHATYQDRELEPGVGALVDFVRGVGPTVYPVDVVEIVLSTHTVGNHTANVHGDRAWAETYVTACLVDRPVDGLRMRTRGVRYIDELTRTTDGWRIHRRTHVCDWTRRDELEWSASSFVPPPPAHRG